MIGARELSRASKIAIIAIEYKKDISVEVRIEGGFGRSGGIKYVHVDYKCRELSCRRATRTWWNFPKMRFTSLASNNEDDNKEEYPEENIYDILWESQMTTPGDPWRYLPNTSVENIAINRSDLENFYTLMEQNGIRDVKFFCGGEEYSWFGIDRKLENTMLGLHEQSFEDARRIADWYFDAFGSGVKNIGELAYSFCTAIDSIDIRKYAAMCHGTLRKSEYSQELAKTKEITLKIMRYFEDIAAFSDAYSNFKLLIAEVLRNFDYKDDIERTFKRDSLAYSYRKINLFNLPKEVLYDMAEDFREKNNGDYPSPKHGKHAYHEYYTYMRCYIRARRNGYDEGIRQGRAAFESEYKGLAKKKNELSEMTQAILEGTEEAIIKAFPQRCDTEVKAKKVFQALGFPSGDTRKPNIMKLIKENLTND